MSFVLKIFSEAGNLKIHIHRQKDKKFDSSSEAGSLKRHIYSVYNATVRKITNVTYVNRHFSE